VHGKGKRAFCVRSLIGKVQLGGQTHEPAGRCKVAGEVRHAAAVAAGYQFNGAIVNGRCQFVGKRGIVAQVGYHPREVRRVGKNAERVVVNMYNAVVRFYNQRRAGGVINRDVYGRSHFHFRHIKPENNGFFERFLYFRHR